MCRIQNMSLEDPLKNINLNTDYRTSSLPDPGIRGGLILGDWILITVVRILLVIHQKL